MPISCGGDQRSWRFSLAGGTICFCCRVVESAPVGQASRGRIRKIRRMKIESVRVRPRRIVPMQWTTLRRVWLRTNAVDLGKPIGHCCRPADPIRPKLITHALRGLIRDGALAHLLRHRRVRGRMRRPAEQHQCKNRQRAEPCAHSRRFLVPLCFHEPSHMPAPFMPPAEPRLAAHIKCIASPNVYRPESPKMRPPPWRYTL